MTKLSFLNFSKISNKRLALRFLKIKDSDAILNLQQNEEIRRFIQRPKMADIQEAVNFINKMDRGITENQHLYWGICLKGHDKVIGTICLWQFNEQPFKADVGYELHPDYQGQGIMDEALAALIDFGFGTLKLEHLEACTNQNNISSIKLLEKNNFSFVKILSKEEKTVEEQDSVLVIYSRKNIEI